MCEKGERVILYSGVYDPLYDVVSRMWGKYMGVYVFLALDPGEMSSTLRALNVIWVLYWNKSWRNRICVLN